MSRLAILSAINTTESRHYVENHPESLKLFDKPVKEEARGTSFENEEQNSKLTDYFNKIPNDSLYLSSICAEILIKEEEGNESLNGDILRESVYYGKRYNCFQSDNIFMEISGQKVYVDTVHKGARCYCENCDRKFSQKWYLFVHKKTDHREKNSYNQTYETKKTYNQIFIM